MIISVGVNQVDADLVGVTVLAGVNDFDGCKKNLDKHWSSRRNNSGGRKKDLDGRWPSWRNSFGGCQ